MSYKTKDGVEHISKVEAAGGRRVSIMPWILGGSTLLIIILLVIVFGVFAV